jgi:RES domain-containing protein
LSFRSVVYRATGHDAPLWAFPNTRAARWNLPDSWPAQYLALHPMTPWAELMRNLDLRDADAARELRVPIWALRITLVDEPIALGFAEAADHALAPADLVADDWSACQTATAELHRAGVGSILVPSAALPGTRNLVVLRPAAVIDYHREPIDDLDQPAAMVARDGRCPRGLWDHVSYVGGPHPDLDAHLAGGEFDFRQP